MTMTETPILPPEKAVYSSQEAAAVLGVSYRTVKREIRAGRLAIHKVGRRTIIRRDDLERVLGTREGPDR